MKILGNNAKGDKIYILDSAEYDYLSTSGKLELKGVYIIKDDRVYVKGGKVLGFTDAFGKPIGRDLKEWEQEEYRTLSQREKHKIKEEKKKVEVEEVPIKIRVPEELVLETPDWIEDILKSAFEN